MRAAVGEALLQRPHVRTPGEADGFWELFRQTSRDLARGIDVPDAHLIALMICRSCWTDRSPVLLTA